MLTGGGVVGYAERSDDDGELAPMSIARLLAAHDGNLESLLDEMRSTEIEAFVERHQLVSRNAALVAEAKFGVRCMRRCVACREVKPASEMRLKGDGRMANRCVDPACDEKRPGVLKQWASKGSTREALLREYTEVSPTVYEAARRPWSRFPARGAPTVWPAFRDVLEAA